MITIQGADEIIEMLEEMIDASKLNGAVDKACLLVEGEARRKAPRRTGNLRRSIESKVENNGDEIVGTIFTPLEYAPYRYVRSLNRAKSGKPKQLKYQTI